MQATTTVTISTGGVSASLNVTVEAGSVRRPCGTVPAKHPPASEQSVAAPVPPPPVPAAAPAPTSAPPVLPVPPPPAVVVVPAPARIAAHAPPPPFLPQAVSPVLVAPFVPPPLLEPVNPTPPSGTSAVTSPVEAAQKEEEREEATESVSNQALAYRQHEHEPAPAYLLGLILLAAFAGASTRPARSARPARGPRGAGDDLGNPLAAPSGRGEETVLTFQRPFTVRQHVARARPR